MSDGVAAIGSTIVGSVSFINDVWWAYGALHDWDDTRLGTFDSEEKAKRRVEQWVKENMDEG